MNFPVFKKFGWLLGALCVGSNAFAQGAAPLNVGHLAVVVEEVADNVINKESFLQALCDGIANKLTAKNGVFGLGAFTGLDCGKQGEDPGHPAYTMKAQADSEKIRIVLGMTIPAKPYVVLASAEFAHSGQAKGLLENDKFNSVVALSLLEQLPVQIRLEGKHSKRHVVTAAEQKLLKDGVKLPTSLNAFTATLSSQGVIYPSSIGRISLKRPKGKKSTYLHEGGSASVINWVLSTKLKNPPATLFGIRSAGRLAVGAVGSDMQRMIDKRAAETVSQINQNLLSKSAKVVQKLLSGGYVGLRYGPALLSGDLIDKSRYFGALVEFRSGILDGLRVYYDYWPEIQGTINGEFGTFGGRRGIVAYSFALKFDSWIRKVDLTPKLGIWSFRSKVPIEFEPGSYVSPEFEVKRAPSFDVELGVETASSLHILRGWVSRAATFVAADKNTKISSSRIGMDLLLSPWGATKPVSVSLLSFYFFESVEMSKSEIEVSEDGGLDQLSYQQAYGGGGIAISW